MSNMSLLHINRLYYDPKALSYNRGKEVFDKYPNAEKVEVDSHWRIESLNEDPEQAKNWNQVKSNYLVLGVKESIASKPNGRSTDLIAPSMSNGCAMACSYCYVARRKGYANPITVFANIDKILGHIERKCGRLGPKVLTEENRQTDPRLWTWDIGENSDCSVDDLVSNNVKDTIELFGRIPNAKACFATKYVNRNLLQYEPRGHTRIRFSLMPANVARVVDVRTSNIHDRIDAINDFVDAGYEVHINLSPVIIYSGWEDDYRDLLHEIDDKLSVQAKSQLAAEVIFLTHNERLHDLNMQWHPEGERQYLWRHWDSPSDKVRNKFGHAVIQQRKISQNGMVNLRYKNNEKTAGVSALKAMMKDIIPYCAIRYIF